MHPSSVWIAVLTLASLVGSIVLAWHLITGRTWDPLFSEGLPDDDYGRGGFYTAQAFGLLRGDAGVPPETLYGECFFRQGRCIGYFGLTPSLLRMPWVGAGSTLDLTSLSMIVGVTVGIAASMLILLMVASLIAPRRQDWTWYHYLLLAIGMLMLGPGNLLLLVPDPRIFNESVIWATAFMLVCLACVTRWFAGFREQWLWVAGIAAILAANSRPSMAVASVGVGLVVALMAWRTARRSRNRALPIMFLTVAPITLLLATYWWKFGAFLPDLLTNESISGRGPIETRQKWVSVMAINGGSTFSLDFLPSHAWAALRPDAVAIQLEPPRSAFFARSDPESFAFLPPAKPGGLYVQPTGSLTTLASGPLLLSIVGVITSLWGRHVNASRARWLMTVALSSALGLCVTWTTVTVANRFLLDAWPALVLGGSTGLCLIMTISASQKFLRAAAVASVGGAVLVSLAISRLLTGI